MACRRQRDEWTEFLRRHAEELRVWSVRIVRRHWRPAVRSRFRVCVWTVFGGFIAACFVCVVVAFWYDVRKHNLSGVPSNHFAVRLEGQPTSVRRGGGSLKERPQFPLTEEQFRAWEENDGTGRGWSRWGAVLCSAGVLVLLLGLRVSRPILRAVGAAKAARGLYGLESQEGAPRTGLNNSSFS